MKEIIIRSAIILTIGILYYLLFIVVLKDDEKDHFNK